MLQKVQISRNYICRHHHWSRNLLDLAMARVRLAQKSRGPCSRKCRLNSPWKSWLLKLCLKSLVCLHLILRILRLSHLLVLQSTSHQPSASSCGLRRMDQARRRPKLKTGLLPLNDGGLW